MQLCSLTILPSIRKAVLIWDVYNESSQMVELFEAWSGKSYSSKNHQISDKYRHTPCSAARRIFFRWKDFFWIEWFFFSVGRYFFWMERIFFQWNDFFSVERFFLDEKIFLSVERYFFQWKDFLEWKNIFLRKGILFGWEDLFFFGLS